MKNTLCNIYSLSEFAVGIIFNRTLQLPVWRLWYHAFVFLDCGFRFRFRPSIVPSKQLAIHVSLYLPLVEISRFTVKNKKKMFLCSTCGELFSYKRNLTRHAKTCNGEFFILFFILCNIKCFFYFLADQIKNAAPQTGVNDSAGPINRK